MAFMSTAAIGLKPEIRLPEIDILLLTVVEEDRLVVEDGEEDLGVDSSELEEVL
jgi:hypothetical protein